MPVANFLTALAATFIFKVALLAYSTSGAEGAESARLTSQDFAFDRQIRFLKHRHIDYMVDRNDMPGRAGAWENAWGINELFDLAHDPDARVDLSRREPALASALEALSRRWQDHSRCLIENYAAVLGSSGRRCVALPSPRGME